MNRFLSAYDLTPIQEDEDALPPSLPPQTKQNNVQAQNDAEIIIPYEKYFDYKKQIEINGEIFSYYQKGDTYKNIAYVCIHGAGFSGLSFAQLAKGLQNEALIICPDLRQHGFSTQNNKIDFQTLVSDLESLIPAILYACDEENTSSTQNTESQTSTIQLSNHQKRWNVVLIGHSLGGSLVTAIQPNNVNILCLVLIDITENTVMASLPQMTSILARRKTQYSNYSDYVQCMLKTRTLLHKKSACIEAPGVLDQNFNTRANLRETTPFWAGWFKGLNTRFLESQAWKLLLVSTLEKLDRDHEIAMMQGRLAVEVIPGTIHNLHEDAPEKVCHTLQQYFRRLHFTDSLYRVEIDFKKGLTDDEKPLSIETIKELVD